MSRISKYLFLLSLIFLISLSIFIVNLYQRDSFSILNANLLSLRFSMFMGLIFMTGLSFVVALVLWKKQSWGVHFQEIFDQFMEWNWVHDSIFVISASIIVILSTFLWDIVFLEVDRYLLILNRFSPLIFIFASLSLMVIRSKYFVVDRDKWFRLVISSTLFLVIGIFLQSILVNQLELSPPISIQYQFVYAFVCIIFSIILFRQQKYESYLLLLLVAFMVVLFVVQWMLMPHKWRRLLPAMVVYAPIIIISFPLIAMFITELWKRVESNSRDVVKWGLQGLLILSLIVLAFIYYQSASRHSREVNTDLTVSDQSAYLKFVQETRRFNFNYTGDHNRMPLYPFLQAIFFHPEMGIQELFEQAKQYNLLLSIVLLIGIYFVLYKSLGFFASYLLLIIFAFTLYIFKAAYVQAEILYYSLSALGFILMLKMIKNPSWLLAIATGIIIGLAYLTKGTILPSLPLFAVLYCVNLGWSILREKKLSNNVQLIEITKKASYLLIVLVLFFLVIFPYAQALKRRFGHYFYNVNTTFYFWYDDFQMAEEEEAKHAFTLRWPEHMAEDELPNLRNYIREHSFQQIVERFYSGFRGQFTNIVNKSFSLTNYWISYLFILLVGILINLKGFKKVVNANLIPLLFVILYFTGYLIAFAWYCSIACERRFTFSLYLPFLITIYLVMRELIKDQAHNKENIEYRIDLAKYFSASNVIVALSLLINIWFITNEILFIDAYGS